MENEKRQRWQRAWLHWRWAVLGLFAFAFLLLIVYSRSAGTQSRWSYRETGPWKVFNEKIVPKDRLEAFRADFPDFAIVWFARLGIVVDLGKGDSLVTFAAWGDYSALGMDDRLIFKKLKEGHASELRLLSIMAKEFKLNEPVASCFATSDGKLLFIDLRGDGKAAAIHGLAHVMARKNIPSAVGERTNAAKAFDYDPRLVRELRFIDEVAALLLSDLYLAGATGTKTKDLEALAAFDEKRYAREGPIYRDEGLTFTFGSDPRTPDAFAGAARFALAAARERGLPAAVAFAGNFLRGDYVSLDQLCTGLGGKLPSLLKRYLGSEDIPE